MVEIDDNSDERNKHIKDFDPAKRVELFNDIVNTINLYAEADDFVADVGELRERRGVVSVGGVTIIGSWAEGRANSNSDLDIVALVKETDGSKISETEEYKIEVGFSNSGMMHPMFDKWPFQTYDLWVVRDEKEYRELVNELSVEGYGEGKFILYDGDGVR